MKILVTGANGYIGTGIVQQLLNYGFSVIANDFSLENVDSRAEKIPTNIFEQENPYEFFGKPDVVLHLAWRDGFNHNSKNHLKDLPEHYRFLEKLICAGISRVCVMGTMHEVGFYEGCINQNTPTNPESLYGISKNALRKAIELLTKKHQVKYQWIRGYYIVGNTQYGCSVFSKIAQAVAEGRSSFPFTMGQNQYDFIDYSEFCQQVTAVVGQDKFLGIINCCSGRPMRLKERVEQFIEENHYAIKLNYGEFLDRPYDSVAVWGNKESIAAIIQDAVTENK